MANMHAKLRRSRFIEDSADYLRFRVKEGSHATGFDSGGLGFSRLDDAHEKAKEIMDRSLLRPDTDPTAPSRYKWLFKFVLRRCERPDTP